jgi:hypothetical protein
MKHATRIGRLAGLAVGLGIGAALAATPGVASADDFQISIDGMDLLPTAGNTATATSGRGGHRHRLRRWRQRFSPWWPV